MSKISIRALIPRGNRKFAQLLSNNVLSEYSTPTETCSSSDAEFYEPPNPTKIKDFEFIEETVDSKDLVTQSLLQMYEKLEKVRNEKWKLKHPEQVALQNMKSLKRLIATNFTKKKNLKVEKSTTETMNTKPNFNNMRAFNETDRATSLVVSK